MSILEIKDLGKTYGTGVRATHAVGRVSFDVADRVRRPVAGAVRLAEAADLEHPL